MTVDEHIAERQAGDEKGVGDVCSGKKRGGRKVTLRVTKTNYEPYLYTSINTICITKYQQGGVGFIFLAPRGQERHFVQES